MDGAPTAPCHPGPGDAEMAQARRRMVALQLRARDIGDPRVLEAMEAVPRHCFVPEGMIGLAHGDHPLPIGHGQTLSQPYIVAYMAQALALKGPEGVLEIGSGSGYALAVLAHLAARVCGVELDQDLCDRARGTLALLGLGVVELQWGDGRRGWSRGAPYDGILVSCAAEVVPKALLDQLAMGGRLVLPLGPEGGAQWLWRITRMPSGFAEEQLLPVRFVPLRGEAIPP